MSEKDPLVGGPVSAEEQALGDALSAWAESDGFTIPDSAQVEWSSPDDEAGRSLVESIVGADELEQIVPRGGRPSLGGQAGTGPSPKRQVRLPRDLDDRLVARAADEHRDLSEIMRDAIAEYLTPHR